MSDMEQMLIHRCKKGDITAYEILISNYEKKVFNTIYGLLGDEREAKEITQETFIQAYRTIESLKEESRFFIYIYRIAIKISKDYLRTKQNTLPTGQLQDEIQNKDTYTLQERYERFEEGQQIRELVENLEEEHRQVVVLRDIQGFSYKEISQILEISLGSVSTRVSRGRRELKDLLMGRKDYSQQK